MPSPVSMAFFLASSWRAIFGFTLNSAGTRARAPPTSRSVSRDTAVSYSESAVSSVGAFSPAQWPSSQSALFGLKLAEAWKASSSLAL